MVCHRSNNTPPVLLYSGLLRATVMAVRAVQPENAPAPMPTKLAGIVMPVRLVQPKNALIPRLATRSGRTI